MYDDIRRCLSREQSLDVLTDAAQYVPPKEKPNYSAALNRVKVEFRRHDPVAPINGRCGVCGAVVDWFYCPNCGREVLRNDD